MDGIQLVDLKKQYEKIKEEIDQAVLDVVGSTAYINGPAVKSFQSDLENYLDVAHVIPCANGTDALQISLMSLGLQPGDEVITPSFTYIATVEVIALLLLKPVFVEVHPDSFLIDPTSIKNAITEKTKAVIPVHLYGQCADMEEIVAIGREHGIPVIEDTAQALGSIYTDRSGQSKKAGTISEVGTTSFFPSKNLGCYGDGGAIFTNDDQLAEKLRMTANHGQSARYYHDSIGCNSRLDSIQAAILKVKLQYLEDYISARQAVADYYDQAFSSVEVIQTPMRVGNSTHGFHQYTIKLDGVNRDELQNGLSEKGVPSNIYYPVPTHLQKGYIQYGFGKGDLPITEKLNEQVLSLPIHTEMDDKQLEYITESVISLCENAKSLA